jgi:CheY-like chemotaxis protein
MSVTVLLVDDVPELRSVLRQRLGLRGGFTVVAEVGDGAAAVTAAMVHQPDVVVLDLGLPDLAGHEVLTGLRAAAPNAQVLVYTGSVSRDHFVLTPDVDAYFTKDRGVADLVELIVKLTAPGRRSARLDLGPGVRDVRLARQFLVAHCARWGCQDIVADAELVVSELVTNAIVHAGRCCELAIAFRSGWLRIEVTDDAGGGPEVQAPDARSEHGRGLLLVSAMTTAWGVEPLPAGGKLVWAALRSASPPAAGDDEDAASQRRSGGGGRAPWPSGPPGSAPGFYVASAVRPLARPDRVAGSRPGRRPTCR